MVKKFFQTSEKFIIRVEKKIDLRKKLAHESKEETSVRLLLSVFTIVKNKPNSGIL